MITPILTIAGVCWQLITSIVFKHCSDCDAPTTSSLKEHNLTVILSSSYQGTTQYFFPHRFAENRDH